MCREFITGVDGAQLYLDEVRIAGGQNPDLVLDDGQRRIDLTMYESVDTLHALMRTEGLTARADRSALNKNSKCWGWREVGECMLNSKFMLSECPLACAYHMDRHDECERWAATGECESNQKYMARNCHVACTSKTEL